MPIHVWTIDESATTMISVSMIEDVMTTITDAFKNDTMVATDDSTRAENITMTTVATVITMTMNVC